MSTLELHWENRPVKLWSWSGPKVHLTTRIVRRIKSRVYAAYLDGRGLEPGYVVALKVAQGDGEVEEMEGEVGFYENELKKLQGRVVPEFYGFFRGKVEGVQVGCMILEYCTGPPATDLLERNRQIMLLCCQLHEAGVFHGDLTAGTHFVRMGGGLRIVDFSTAVRHKCSNGIPALYEEAVRAGCAELSTLEQTFGVYSGGSIPQRVLDRR